jgi:hypothetical protein
MLLLMKLGVLYKCVLPHSMILADGHVQGELAGHGTVSKSRQFLPLKDAMISNNVNI